jgi:hypothetical protein
METKKMTDRHGFEIQSCSRCGGSGHYSYCQMHGTVCFGCGGSGKQYTKRGRKAHDMFEAALKVPLGSLKVGDLMRVEDLGRRYFAKVAEIGPLAVTGKSLVDGVWVPMETITVTTEHERYGRHGLIASPGHPVRKGWSSEEKEPHRQAALAFEATMGPSGKVLKKFQKEVA